MRSLRPTMVCTALLLPAVALAEPRALTVPDGVQYDQGLVYHNLGQGKTLKLDIARPRGKGPFPAIVLVPGGGWLSKGRTFKRPLQFELAARGYVAVSADYRFSPDSRFPAQLHDAKAAIRWLRANAQRHAIDGSRLAAVGYSAGGNIASLLGLTTPKDKLEGEGDHPNRPSHVSLVISVSGISDFASLYTEHCLRMPVTRETLYLRFVLDTFLGGPPMKAPDLYRKASAASYVRKDAPPMLLIHGTEDKVIPLSQSMALRDRLAKEGVKVTLEEIKGGGHDFAGTFEERANKAMLAFLDKHLKPR